ncbi:URC4/urg3 family protein [Limnofasciculus baicalensis]|uniref:URC4/urg3 family protein n=1 Tax=Limnofasciculus baicalensis BBK-W-15 TaxID=2699891 RepID=A0AAE3KNG2_9CYAN|nr:URC4/urg3 family protein [Limnofasciculus baicalensis]MCP2730485.1 URC4/urg3 family protein [Limnofasciculus baicalensis BBK-W-15]
MTNDEQTIAYLRTTAAIRERCDRLFDLCCNDQLSHFRCNLTQLDKVADYVIEVIGDEYPDFKIPFHSRWRHFEVGNIPRLAELEQKLVGFTPLEKVHIKFDLVIVSVLLDAGAGPDWQYREAETGLVFCRSEGLAIASFHIFCQGMFSSDSDYPLQVDAKGLQELTIDKLATGFQVSATNPLVGLSGRLELLQRLGDSLLALPQIFGNIQPRPGNLVDYLLNLGIGNNNLPSQVETQKFPPSPLRMKHLDISIPVKQQRLSPKSFTPTQNSSPDSPLQKTHSPLPAKTILTAVIEGLGNIWPGRIAMASPARGIGNVNLGDVWIHPALKGDTPYQEYVPFHKLSQWLTYSLLEPLQEFGIEITGLEELTGLPEYRNGGLFLDLGLLEVKDTTILQKPHLPGSEIIVEWRALTVILLDKLAETIRQKLNLTPAELPLVKVLQGGSWTAGRRMAAKLRQGGIPPIQIESDGTVF